MADVVIGSLTVVSGQSRQAIAAEAISVGQAVYVNQSNQLARAGAALTPVEANAVGIAIQGAKVGEVCVYVTNDAVINLGPALTQGGVYVVSATLGGIAPYADLVATNQVTVLGVAAAANLPINIIPSGIALA